MILVLERMVANTRLNVQQLAVALEVSECTAWFLKNKPKPNHLFIYGTALEKLDISSKIENDWAYMKSLIDRTGLTQDEIAKCLEVSLRTVSYMKSPSRKHRVSKHLREALERLVFQSKQQ